MNPFKSKNMEATHETHSHLHMLLNVNLASIPNAFPTYTSRHPFSKLSIFIEKPINREKGCI